MSFLSLVNPFARPKSAALKAPAAKTSAAGPVIAWNNVGQPKWTSRRYESLAEEGFRKNVIAYRCVMQIATASAAIPWLLYDDEGHELDRHPLLDLLRHPNPTQDGVSFLESIYANLEISGNAYVEAVKPNNSDQPYELYVLRPDRMKVIPGPAGLPQGYQYSVNGQVTTWSADPITGASNILHLKRFHPLDDWYGMPPMEAALISIDQHNAAGAWNQALLNHGARPSGALVYAPKDGPASLSDDQMQRLREEMDMMYQGRRNAGRPLILEGGLDWREMSLSPKDMDWLAGRDAAARDIAQAFGVPAQLVGIPGSQTYANMAEARMAFYEETVLPVVTRVIAGVDHWLTPMFDDRLVLDFDLDSISALTPRRDANWAKLQAVSFLTPNEKRAAVGYGPVDGGDGLWPARKSAVMERRFNSHYSGHTRYSPTPAAKDDDDGGDFGDDDGDDLLGGDGGDFAPPVDVGEDDASYSTPKGINYDDEIHDDMADRGWTPEQVDDAVENGDSIDAINKITGGPATRYVHPDTGQSVVIDNAANEVIHVGGPGFKYGHESGDVPGASLGGGGGGGGLGFGRPDNLLSPRLPGDDELE